jgi:hypothetical protein
MVMVLLGCAIVLWPFAERGGTPPWLPVFLTGDDWMYFFWVSDYPALEFHVEHPVITDGSSIHGAEVTSLPFQVLAWLFGIPREGFPNAVRITCVLLTGCLVLALARQWMSRGFAILAAVVLVADPYHYWGKPFYALTEFITHKEQPGHFVVRFLSCVNHVAFLGALMAVGWLYLRGGTSSRRSVAIMECVGGALCAMLASSTPFCFAVVGGHVGILVLFTLRRRRWQALLPLGPLLMSVPVLLYRMAMTAPLQALPYYRDWVELSGWGFFTHAPDYLFAPQVLGLALLSAALWWRTRSERLLPLLAVSLSTYALLNQNLVTGLNIQNDHFFHGAGVTLSLCWLGLMEAGFGWGQRRWPTWVTPVRCGALLVLLTAVSLNSGMGTSRIVHRQIQQGDATLTASALFPNTDSLVALRTVVKKGSNICGDYTGQYVATLTHSQLVHYQWLQFFSPLDPREVAERRVTCLRLAGWSRDDLEEAFTKEQPYYLQRERAQSWLTYFQTLTRETWDRMGADDVRAHAQRWRVDVVPVEALRTQKATEALTELNLPFTAHAVGGLTLFRLGPR